MENKFKKGLEERKINQAQQVAKKPPVDFETFIESAASDGALNQPEITPLKLVEKVVEKVSVSPLERLLSELHTLQEAIKETGKKGKIEKITASMHKEQTLKAEIIKMVMEEEKGIELSMSKVIAMLIDKKFDELDIKK
ncbi:hypothetical protein JE006_22895 [Pseudomonas aeruginosa]|nr:hypothetical protein [Pseudomonas aeruginosa]HEJ1837327.1 hypothetical protein [Pseudomonas aeruginosa]HEK3577580.1 hypothetical protein [Pseudomonas aeruginosa]HEK3590469.1 hypothetical protein [Pseudomonas aeruginosa]